MELFLKHTTKVEIKGIEDQLDLLIYQNEERNVSLMRIHFYNKDRAISSSTILPSFFGNLEATLSNGAKILLVGCKRVQHISEISYHREVFKYEVDYVIDGASIEENRFFKAYYKVSGIMKWFQKTNFAFGLKGNHYIDISNDNKLIIYEAKDHKIEYYVGYSLPNDFLKETITITQNPSIIIESKEAQKIQWFDTKFNDFKAIIELATHKRINYQEVSVQAIPPKDFTPINSVLYSVDSSFSTRKNKEEGGYNNYLFTCQDLVDSGNLNCWHKKRSKLEPVLDLYLEVYYSGTSKIENHFLNICQALETYHARMISDSKNEYKKMAKSKLEGYQSEWEKFLIRDPRKSHILLSERLSDLMFIDYPRYIFSGSFKFFDFPQIVSDTRNYFTHYNINKEKKALKGENLVESISLLRGILEYHLLKEIGFTDENIFKNLNEYFLQVRTNTEYRNALRDSDKEKFGIEEQ